MPTKTIRLASAPIFGVKDFQLATDVEGTFEGVVAVFGNVDLGGDRIVPGAFAKSLDVWKESGAPIPVIWSHGWDDPANHLGEVLEAKELYAGDERLPEAIRANGGLWIKGRLDMEETRARQVWKLMKSRRVKEFSFAYDVPAGGERRASDGANDLAQLEVIEVGPTLKGMNPVTQLIDVKHRDPRDKAAIASHSTATSSSSWDGPANEANLSNDDGADVYRKAYAWVDDDSDEDAKSSYKFIHHFVADSGSVGAASTTACSTGIGVLNGGRGGTTIPDSDRQGVYDHLAKHLRDADMDPPELASSGQSSGGAGGTKAIVTLEGSMEQRQEAILREIYSLDRQTLDSMANGGLYAPWLEATYDDRAIVLMEGWDDPVFEGRYWQFPITVEGDGSVSLGEPVEVTVSGTVTPKARAKELKASAKQRAEALDGRDGVKSGGNPEDPARGNGEDPEGDASATGTGEASRLLLELELLELS